MRKFMKWFIVDSSIKWAVLAILSLLILMLVSGEMLGVAFFGVVLFVAFIGVATSWANLVKLEKEGKIKL